LEKATAIADEMLDTHRPQPLPEDVRRELRAIVARADKALAGI
jgi:trimethylamine:corrinoid methyltransferase-like protein